MLEIMLQSISPLQGAARLGRSGRMDGDAGVIVREIKEFEAIHISAGRGSNAEVCAILSTCVGAEVADAPGRVGGNGLAILGVAPGQWLAVERGARTSQLLKLRDSLPGRAAVTDQGAGKIMLEISGSHARAALCKGIPVDLDPVVFNVGSSAQTVAAHIGLQLSLIDAAPTFELISAASTSSSLWTWLSQSAHEFGLLVI